MHYFASSEIFCSLYFQFLPDVATDAGSSLAEHLPVVRAVHVLRPKNPLCSYYCESEWEYNRNVNRNMNGIVNGNISRTMNRNVNRNVNGNRNTIGV